jgi:hypothetical protein
LPESLWVIRLQILPLIPLRGLGFRLSKLQAGLSEREM